VQGLAPQKVEPQWARIHLPATLAMRLALCGEGAVRVLRQSLAPDVVAQSAQAAQDRLGINRYRQDVVDAKCEFALEAPSFGARITRNVLTGRIVGDCEETVVIALEEICQGGITFGRGTVGWLHVRDRWSWRREKDTCAPITAGYYWRAICPRNRSDVVEGFTDKTGSYLLNLNLSLNPGFDGAPDRWLEYFDKAQAVPAYYNIPTQAGAVHVALSDPVRSVLPEIKLLPGRRAAGARAEAFLLNPVAALGEDATKAIDVDQFSAAKEQAGIEFDRFREFVNRDALG